LTAALLTKGRMRKIRRELAILSVAGRWSADRVAGVGGDILDHNCRRQGLMESHALVRSLVASVRFWLGFHGCGTSLLYRVSRSKVVPAGPIAGRADPYAEETRLGH
jgi:hypothetical protein